MAEVRGGAEGEELPAEEACPSMAADGEESSSLEASDCGMEPVTRTASTILAFNVSMLKQVVHEPALTVVDALTPLIHRELVEESISALALLLDFSSSDTPFLTSLIHAEVAATKESFSLFRETTARSLILSKYLHTASARYLTRALKPVVDMVREPSCSLSADRPADVSHVCDTVLKRLIEGVEQLPAPAMSVFSSLLAATTQKFPTDKYTALGGLFLLRMVCPALASPVRYAIIDCECTLGIRELKLLALCSKVLLMAGVGARFSATDGKQELNDIISHCSAPVLRLLDSVSSKFSVDRKVQVPQQRLRSYTTSSQRIPVDLVVGTSKYTVLVDRGMTAKMVMEMATRLKCPPPLQKNIRETRDSLKAHKMFIGPRRARSGGVSADEFVLLADDDLVWQGIAAPEYTLWFVEVDAGRMNAFEKALEERKEMHGRVEVQVDGTSFSLPCSDTTTADDIRERLLEKLAEGASEASLAKIEKKYRDYWLFVPGHDDPIVPYGSVIILEHYNSPPSRLCFTLTTEQQRRKTAKLRLQQQMSKTNANMGALALEKGIVRVYCDFEVGFRTTQVLKTSRAVDVFHSYVRKIAKERNTDAVIGDFANHWLFEVEPVSRDVKATRNESPFSRLLASIKGDGAKSPKGTRRRSESEDELLKRNMHRYLEALVVKQMFHPGDVMWADSVEPDVFCRTMTDAERRKLSLEVRQLLVECECGRLEQLPFVRYTREQMEQERARGVNTVLECLSRYRDEIVAAGCARAGMEVAEYEATAQRLSSEHSSTADGSGDEAGGGRRPLRLLRRLNSDGELPPSPTAPPFDAEHELSAEDELQTSAPSADVTPRYITGVLRALDDLLECYREDGPMAVPEPHPPPALANPSPPASTAPSDVAAAASLASPSVPPATAGPRHTAGPTATLAAAASSTASSSGAACSGSSSPSADRRSSSPLSDPQSSDPASDGRGSD
eukprot:TRINITY_DN576_c0_g1_i3.p1 TRINITY_DN576_c0_g1~~TRINITY_DN576_c0_g1_i3.p1  ORF type:complete len:960 (+),score=365.13 TRINITY_DN576_c0_g1_i3:173-3052(+)